MTHFPLSILRRSLGTAKEVDKTDTYRITQSLPFTR